MEKNVKRKISAIVNKRLNESFTKKTSIKPSSELHSRAETEAFGDKYDVILYWEASLCDTVRANSSEEAIELALEKNKKKVDEANKILDMYDSTVGLCPQHRAELSDF